MKKKIFVIAAVVVAVMALGISSAFAFGGPGRDDAATRYGRYADCDGTCDNEAPEPQDGTGNQYGTRANGTVCDGDCDTSARACGNGRGDCDGTCDEDRDAPQDGTGNQYGMRAGNRDNSGTCGNANGVQGGRGGQCSRNR